MFTENDYTRLCCDSRIGFSHLPKCLVRGENVMGQHSTPRGEHSTMQGNDPKGGNTPGYNGTHRKPEVKPAGSDLPSRDQNLQDPKTK